MLPQNHRILIIDDDLDQQFLEKRALQKVLNGRSTINLVCSGKEAIAYMMGEGEFSDRARFPFPSLMITDLNMNDGDGFDVLEFMQANPAWNVVPRIVFSSSTDDDDVRTAYFLGASAYHCKPDTPALLESRMREIVTYWSSAEVPPVDECGRTLATNSKGRLGERYEHPSAGLTMKRPAPADAAVAESRDSRELRANRNVPDG